MRDLLEKLNQLTEAAVTEAAVKPGERKTISFRIAKLEKIKDQLDAYYSSLNALANNKMPPSLAAEAEALRVKLRAEIDKVDRSYNDALVKAQVDGRPIKMNNLFKALAKNCKQIVKVYKELNNNFAGEKKRFMYRGIRSSSDALYGKPFTERKPKDSNPELHTMLNDAMVYAGLDARRNNAMFVSGDLGQAKSYGTDVFVFFPVDGFTFTWSKNIKDLVLDASKKIEMLDKRVASELRRMVVDAKAEDDSINVNYPNDLFTSGYSFTDDVDKVKELIKDGKLPDSASELVDKILTNDTILEYFDFSDTNIFDAITSHKEIYVKGDYYAVNTDHIDELIKFLKEIDVDSVELPESFGEVPVIIDRGDVVRVTGGTNKGKIGTVTYEYSDTVEIKQVYGDPSFTVDKSLLEPYSQDDNYLDFAMKDKVIVNNPASRNYGSVGDITSRAAPGQYYVRPSDGSPEIMVLKSELAKYTPELEAEIQKELLTAPPAIKEGDIVVVTDKNSEYYKQQGKASFVYSSGKIEVRLPDKYQEFQKDQLIQLKFAPPELKVPFAVGDLVKLNSNAGSLAGKTGKITSGPDADSDYVVTYDNSPEDDIGWGYFKAEKLTLISPSSSDNTSSVINSGTAVEINRPGDLFNGKTGKVISGPDSDGDYLVAIDDSSAQEYYQPEYLKVPGDDSDAASTDEPPIKVGDTVKIVNADSSYHNSTGKVTEVTKLAYPNEYDGNYKITVASDTNSLKFTTYMNWAEKVDQPQQTFNKGDKFKVKEKSFSVNGKIATISDGPDSDGDYKSVTDDGKIIYTQLFQMEKIDGVDADSTATLPTSAFKVGDTVKVNSNVKSLMKDKTGTVTEVDTQNDLVHVKFAEGEELYYKTSEVTKTDASAKPGTFKVGDKVKITEPLDPSDKDRVGVIIPYHGGGATPKLFKVEFGSEGNALFYANEMSHYEDSESPSTTSPDATYRIGDMVQVTDPALINNGKIYKVEFVYQSGSLSLVSDDGTGVYANPSQVKPYSEPAKSDQQPLMQGDTVEINSQYPSLEGKTGVIVSSSSNFSTVKLDGLNGTTSSFPNTALVKTDKSSSEQPELHLGDSVEVINSELSTLGKQGKIVDTMGTIHTVQLSDDPVDVIFVTTNSLKKITPSN